MWITLGQELTLKITPAKMTLMNEEHCIIYIVRHGETDWNAAKRVQGQTDIPLNATGEEQAKEVSLLLKNVQFDAIFSSDLVRAKRTAEIIALERQMAVETREQLREQHFGKFEGKHRDEFLKLFTRWQELSEEERFHYTVGDEESNHQALTRFQTVLRELGTAFRGKTILIVAHGALMRYLLVSLGEATLENPKFMKNTGYIKLRTDGLIFELQEVYGVEERVK